MEGHSMWILAPAFLAIYIAFAASPAAPAEYTRSERCHELIHIDLPWNPARLEQRNGRKRNHASCDALRSKW